MTARSTRPRWTRWAFGLALVVHLVVLYAPDAPGGVEVTGLDKVVHLAVFGGLVVTGVLAGLPLRGWALAVAVHAPVSELVQHFALAHRDGDWRDAVADLVGVAAGVLVARGMMARWQVSRVRGSR